MCFSLGEVKSGIYCVGCAVELQLPPSIWPGGERQGRTRVLSSAFVLNGISMWVGTRFCWWLPVRG